MQSRSVYYIPLQAVFQAFRPIFRTEFRIEVLQTNREIFVKLASIAKLGIPFYNEITGDTVDNELINRIFERFCVGK